MFYEGDLQSGVTAAIQQAKQVACFVKDDSEESSTWENDYLNDDSLVPLLEANAVLLRLEIGSQEAGFLGAFCPVSKAPTLVIIHNGQLREYIAPGTTKEEVITRLKAVLQTTSSVLRAETTISAHPQPSPHPPITQQPPAHAAGPAAVSPPNTNHPLPTFEPNTSTSPPSASASATLSHPTSTQIVTEERRVRAEQHKEVQKPAGKAARAEQARDADSRKPEEQDFAAQQREREKAARAERARILAVIEGDKIERRQREEQRRALARPETGAKNAPKEEATVAESSGASSASTAEKSRPCALQVRLLDGSTIRSRFPPTTTLGREVRDWVDKNLPSEPVAPPYTFKHILSPAPPRAIDVGQEHKPLYELGFAPSATLVLVPIAGASDAYPRSFISRAAATGYGVVASGVGFVGGTIGAVVGYGASMLSLGGAPEEGQKQADGQAVGGSRTGQINIKTLRDQQDEARAEQQFYNGNALNFEPNRDDDDKVD